MSKNAKSELRDHVAAWLAELDSCYETQEKFPPIKRRLKKRRVLIHPLMVEHTGKLHHLIKADYSHLLKKSEVKKYPKKLLAKKLPVPLERSNFPADYYWTIIKKWNRWKKLRVIERIEEYVKDLVSFWERQWLLHGGAASPYTRQWIQYDNLLDAHRSVHGCEAGSKQLAQWDREFPPVAVMRRIERGEPARSSDGAILEALASPWCKQQVSPDAQVLIKKLRLLEVKRAELRGEGIDELCVKASTLYAAVLAQDIQARHQAALAVVRSWNSGWGQHISAYFSTLANADYIRRLRKIMPMQSVGDPEWAQKLRIKNAKEKSAKKSEVERKRKTRNRP